MEDVIPSLGAVSNDFLKICLDTAQRRTVLLLYGYAMMGAYSLGNKHCSKSTPNGHTVKRL